MLSASLFDGAPLDVITSFEDARSSSEVDVSWGEVVQAFVVAAVIVVVDEGRYGTFEITGQVVVLKQDAALQREVPALDLSLGHRMIGLSARMAHALVVEPLGKLARNVGWAVVGQQPWPLTGIGLVQP